MTETSEYKFENGKVPFNEVDSEVLGRTVRTAVLEELGIMLGTSMYETSTQQEETQTQIINTLSDDSDDSDDDDEDSDEEEGLEKETPFRPISQRPKSKIVLQKILSRITDTHSSLSADKWGQERQKKLEKYILPLLEELRKTKAPSKNQMDATAARVNIATALTVMSKALMSEEVKTQLIGDEDLQEFIQSLEIKWTKKERLKIFTDTSIHVVALGGSGYFSAGMIKGLFASLANTTGWEVTAMGLSGPELGFYSGWAIGMGTAVVFTKKLRTLMNDARNVIREDTSTQTGFQRWRKSMKTLGASYVSASVGEIHRGFKALPSIRSTRSMVPVSSIVKGLFVLTISGLDITSSGGGLAQRWEGNRDITTQADLISHGNTEEPSLEGMIKEGSPSIDKREEMIQTEISKLKAATATRIQAEAIAIVKEELNKGGVSGEAGEGPISDLKRVLYNDYDYSGPQPNKTAFERLDQSDYAIRTHYAKLLNDHGIPQRGNLKERIDSIFESYESELGNAFRRISELEEEMLKCSSPEELQVKVDKITSEIDKSLIIINGGLEDDIQTELEATREIVIAAMKYAKEQGGYADANPKAVPPVELTQIEIENERIEVDIKANHAAELIFKNYGERSKGIAWAMIMFYLALGMGPTNFAFVSGAASRAAKTSQDKKKQLADKEISMEAWKKMAVELLLSLANSGALDEMGKTEQIPREHMKAGLEKWLNSLSSKSYLNKIKVAFFSLQEIEDHNERARKIKEITDGSIEELKNIWAEIAPGIRSLETVDTKNPVDDVSQTAKDQTDRALTAHEREDLEQLLPQLRAGALKDDPNQAIKTWIKTWEALKKLQKNMENRRPSSGLEESEKVFEKAKKHLYERLMDEKNLQGILDSEMTLQEIDKAGTNWVELFALISNERSSTHKIYAEGEDYMLTDHNINYIMDALNEKKELIAKLENKSPSEALEIYEATIKNIKLESSSTEDTDANIDRVLSANEEIDKKMGKTIKEIIKDFFLIANEEKQSAIQSMSVSQLIKMKKELTTFRKNQIERFKHDGTPFFIPNIEIECKELNDLIDERSPELKKRQALLKKMNELELTGHLSSIIQSLTSLITSIHPDANFNVDRYMDTNTGNLIPIIFTDKASHQIMLHNLEKLNTDLGETRVVELEEFLNRYTLEYQANLGEQILLGAESKNDSLRGLHQAGNSITYKDQFGNKVLMACDIGPHSNRNENQDRQVQRPDGLTVTIDGMGGMGQFGGAYAQKLGENLQQDKSQDPREALIKSHEITYDAEFENMDNKAGAAVVAHRIIEEAGQKTLKLAWSGDARLCVIRNGKIEFKTKDHAYTHEEARLLNKPQYEGVLKHALQMDKRTHDKEIESAEFILQPGDRIISMSDGVYGKLKTEHRLIELVEGVDLNDQNDIQRFLQELSEASKAQLDNRGFNLTEIAA
jgi:serine/threonine protein phosphatase PrpC